ncbi:nuclease-related domain-containing protein [Suttonella ornithocola]|uniref:Nuclease-related domain n=1 Tax=Suttonella ornithocola TaxID=279832 RepID=A0A380MMA0_9GAMM|nr:nuclease-related domain-containing protein [Suttonella ornithocola]SUO93755.1 Nuclease-related domain [Suttonella ornithocola]
MATFLTRNLKSKMTAGERRFYDLLAQHLNDDYLIWYNLPLQGNYRRYPDYLIFHPKYGLLSIEIKDWAMKALKKLKGHHQLTLDFGQGESTYDSPLEQARSSLFPLINKLKEDPLLLQTEGVYKGKLIIPWGYGAVMTNWEYQKITDVARGAIETLFPRKTTFYKEDILEGNLSQTEFIEKLHGLFPYQFNYPITFEQATRIRARIFPEFIVNADQQVFF